MIPSAGCIWSIYPPRGREVREMMSRAKPSAGPAQDAEDLGLPVTVDGAIAIVHIEGVMIKPTGWEWWGFASTLGARRAVEAAAADPAIQAIILRIDSPGGSVDGLAELGDAIFAARQIKPVVAQIDGMAASAGYYAASQASRIYAQRMDMVGSIGTYMMLYDFSKWMAEQGIEPILVTTGDYKGAGEFGPPVTEAQRAEFQAIVDGYFADFKSMIQRGRPLSGDQLKTMADGRVWLAAEAQQMGLIDRIQTMEQTLAELRGGQQQAARSRMARAKAESMSRAG